MNVKLTATGVNQIDQVLKGLPNQLQHRVLQAAHAEASNPLLAKAKSIVPVRTGKLKNSISVNKPSITRASQIGIVEVGPMGVNYGSFVEFGHNLVTRSGVKIGFVKERPYLKPAFDQTKGIVIQNITNSIAKKLLSYMRKTIKNNA